MSGHHNWHFLIDAHLLCEDPRWGPEHFNPGQTRPIDHESARPQLCFECVRAAGIDHLIDDTRTCRHPTHLAPGGGRRLTVSQFNARAPIGTLVRHHPCGSNDYVESRTRSKAREIEGFPSVMIEGHGGYVGLETIILIEELAAVDRG
jgi:hypothetical protein